MAEEAAATAEAATAEATSATEATATGKTFSQEELNAIVQDRLARAAKGQPSKDELAELQKAKADLDKIQEAGASELEKANKAREAAEVKATAALATANDRLLKSEAVTALVAAGVNSVDAAFRALDKTGLTVEDDGTVSGIDEAVKQLLEEVPALVGKGTSGSADQGARGGGPDQITLEQMKAMDPAKLTKHLNAGDLDHLTRA